MKLFIDVETRTIIDSLTYARPTPLIALKRRDNMQVDVAFVKSGAVVELSEGATGRLGIKVADDYASPFIASATSWTKTGTEEDTIYSFGLNLNTEDMDTAFGEEPATLPAMLEIVWTEGAIITSSNTLVTAIQNDVVRGDEGVPASGGPPYPSAAAVIALVDAGPAPAINTDSTFAANSDTVVPSQKAVKTALAGHTSLTNNPHAVTASQAQTEWSDIRRVARCLWPTPTNTAVSGTGSVTIGFETVVSSGSTSGGYARVCAPYGLNGNGYSSVFPANTPLAIAFSFYGLTLPSSYGCVRVICGPLVTPAAPGSSTPMTNGGFGLEMDGGSSSTPRIKVFAHNGSTLTFSSWANIGSTAANVLQSLILAHDGAGTVSCYAAGVTGANGLPVVPTTPLVTTTGCQTTGTIFNTINLHAISASSGPPTTLTFRQVVVQIGAQ